MARTKQTARRSAAGEAPAHVESHVESHVETLTVEDALQAENDALKVTNNKLCDQNVDLNDENQTLYENNEALKRDMERLKEEFKITKDLVTAQSNVIQMYMKQSTADEKLQAFRDLVSVQNESMKEMDDALHDHKKLLEAKDEELEFLRETLVERMDDPHDPGASDMEFD